jgi:hypothetical protein
MTSTTDATSWWINRLKVQLDDFLQAPFGGSDKGLRELMQQYQEAVKSKQVETPIIYGGYK